MRLTLPGRDQADHLEKEGAAKELFQTALRDQADQQKGSTMTAHGNLAFIRGTSTIIREVLKIAVLGKVSGISRGERKTTRGGVEALWSKEEVFKKEEVVGVMMDTSRTGVGATIVMGMKEGSMEASITGKTIGIGMKQGTEVATLGQATVEAINQQAVITSQDNTGVKVRGGTVGTKKVLTMDEVMHQVADGKERDQGMITGPTKAAVGNIKGTDIAAGHGLSQKSRVVGVGVD